MPQVAFFVGPNHVRLPIQIPDRIRDHGHVRLRFYGNPRTVTLNDYTRLCRIEIWDGASLPGDKIEWTHSRDEVFHDLKLVDDYGMGHESAFCTDAYVSEYHDYAFSFVGRYDRPYTELGKQRIVLSCNKTLKPNNVEAWYRLQREQRKDQKVDSHFDLLVGAVQGDGDCLAKLGKTRREIDAEITAGLLRYARSQVTAADVRPFLQKYAIHTIAHVRSVAQDMLRHLEETDGRFSYREQQEAALRNLGQFNGKHLPLVMKAIGKRLTGYGGELCVYGRMFRATLKDHWEHEDIKAVWDAVSQEYLPTRSQVMVTLLRLHAVPGVECGTAADFEADEMRHRIEAGKRLKSVGKEKTLTESMTLLSGKAIPYPEVVTIQGGVGENTEADYEQMAARRSGRWVNANCVGAGDPEMVESYKGQQKTLAWLRGVNVDWDESLKVAEFSEFCKDCPDVAASAKRIWEAQNPRISDEAHDKIVKEVKEADHFELSMMPDVGNDTAWNTYAEYYKAEHATAQAMPPADGGPEPMYPPESNERLMKMRPCKSSCDGDFPLEGGQKSYVLLACGRHECDYKDSPFHQQLELRINGITLSDRQGHLDIVEARDGKLVRGYRYHDLSRVSGDTWRYGRCEEVDHSCTPKS